MEKKTALRAIKEKCMDCCSNEIMYVKTCPSIRCPIWHFRLGMHPYDKRSKKAKENALLSPKNFVGFEYMTPQDFMKHIKEDCGGK